jgi:hypothetical protein
MIRYVDLHWGKPAIIAEQLMSPTLSMEGKVLYMRKGGMHSVWESRKAGGG